MPNEKGQTLRNIVAGIVLVCIIVILSLTIYYYMTMPVATTAEINPTVVSDGITAINGANTALDKSLADNKDLVDNVADAFKQTSNSLAQALNNLIPMNITPPYQFAGCYANSNVTGMTKLNDTTYIDCANQAKTGNYKFFSTSGVGNYPDGSKIQCYVSNTVPAGGFATTCSSTAPILTNAWDSRVPAKWAGDATSFATYALTPN